MYTYKQFKKVLIPMVKSILHLFKIHRKVIFGNPSIIVQNVFDKRPESLNAVNVIFEKTFFRPCAI